MTSAVQGQPVINHYPRWSPAQAWQQAYDWVCLRRRHYPVNADIWHLRFHWATLGQTLWEAVQQCRYRLHPMQVLGAHALWGAADALVLKWLALMSAPWLDLHPACEHGLGGGVHASRARLHQALREGHQRHVMRTDIRGYYQHIDKQQVWQQVVSQLPGQPLHALWWQFLHYSVECGGEFHTPERGIPRGCALSPLIGAALLTPLDRAMTQQMEKEGGYYARYMDDILVLAPKRWPLRRAIASVNQHLAVGGFVQHPDKTMIGPLTRGFDWLGGWFTEQGCVGIAPRALQRYRTKSLRLYEQALRQGLGETGAKARVRRYHTRWLMVTGGTMTSMAGRRYHGVSAPTY